ncbi:hypothetical protein B0H13DRAFT_2299931 [Mycena leptocephala]|nr:hypothetical protein B0H13DRAFT_2299931 [Mycena leptocephala]
MKAPSRTRPHRGIPVAAAVTRSSLCGDVVTDANLFLAAVDRTRCAYCVVVVDGEAWVSVLEISLRVWVLSDRVRACAEQAEDGTALPTLFSTLVPKGMPPIATTTAAAAPSALASPVTSTVASSLVPHHVRRRVHHRAHRQ